MDMVWDCAAQKPFQVKAWGGVGYTSCMIPSLGVTESVDNHLHKKEKGEIVLIWLQPKYIHLLLSTK